MTRLLYTLGRKIGEGSSGIVYRATLSDGRTVAVKRLSPGHSALGQHREAQTLARLDHPNIVQFYALQRAPEKPEQYDLITELVPGITLARLYKRGPVPVTLAVYIVRQVLAALEHIHTTTDLVHRDVSEGNILIGHDGQVKLADFGLTKPSTAARTTTVLRGTPPYLSPEHISYDQVGAQSDLFVVGIHLYRLLTGTMPLHDDGIADLKEQRPLVPPIALRPELPRALDAITRKLLKYDIENRYASATAVLAALPDVDIAGLDLAVFLRQQAPASRWRKAMTRLAGLAAAALIGAGAMHALQPERTAPAAEELAASSELDQSTAAVCEPAELPIATERDDSTTGPALDAETTETSKSTTTTHHARTPQESTPRRPGRERAAQKDADPGTNTTTEARAQAIPKHAREQQPTPSSVSQPADPRAGARGTKPYVPEGTRAYYPGARKDDRP